MTDQSENADSTSTIVGLCFFLLLLIVLLVILYKYLNRQTNGQYTIQRLVYAEGGLRDRVLQGIEIVEERINAYRQPQNRDEEDAIGSEDTLGGNDEKEGAAKGQSQNEDNEKENGEDAEDVDDAEDDSSDDYSSIDLRERVNKNKSSEVEEKDVKQKEETKDGGEEDDPKQEGDEKNEERVGLLIDLKSFSGSAIWSEENKDEGNVTAL